MLRLSSIVKPMLYLLASARRGEVQRGIIEQPLSIYCQLHSTSYYEFLSTSSWRVRQLNHLGEVEGISEPGRIDGLFYSFNYLSTFRLRFNVHQYTTASDEYAKDKED